MNKPIVRFAPSPTGYLHIGGARTALFNYLFAMQNQGKFLLRIEDTDLSRSSIKYTDQIIDALTWLDIGWSSMVIQTDKSPYHKKMVEQMIELGAAYRCFLSSEELDVLRKDAENKKQVFRVPKTYRNLSIEDQQKLIDKGKLFTVRIKVPEGVTEFTDLVFGKIAVENKDIDDFIIARSDGSPTYNFVVAVDDSDMKITHVIRGDDHLANTPKQILVYKALGLKVPVFAHLPLILGPDKKRLSKRHAATNVQEYKDKGFTPLAIINYLSLLGWNPDSNQEIFSHMGELIEKFKFEQVQKKSAIFDEKKLLWISGQHMANASIDTTIIELEKLKPDWATGQASSYKKDVLKLTKERSKTLVDLIEISETFFSSQISYDTDVKNTIWNDSSKKIVEDLLNALTIENNWDKKTLESVFENLMNQHNLSLGKLIQPIRFVLSGLTYGPGIFDTMVLLGKEACIKRLAAGLKELN